MTGVELLAYGVCAVGWIAVLFMAVRLIGNMLTFYRVCIILSKETGLSPVEVGRGLIKHHQESERIRASGVYQPFPTNKDWQPPPVKR